MADPAPSTQQQRQQTRNEREERAATFWQEKINSGRALMQTQGEQAVMERQRHGERHPISPATHGEEPERKQRGPYRTRTR